MFRRVYLIAPSRSKWISPRDPQFCAINHAVCERFRGEIKVFSPSRYTSLREMKVSKVRDGRRVIRHLRAVPARCAHCSPPQKSSLPPRIICARSLLGGTREWEWPILRVSPIHQSRPRSESPDTAEFPARATTARGPSANGLAGIMVPLCSHYGAIYGYVRAPNPVCRPDPPPLSGLRPSQTISVGHFWSLIDVGS